MNKITWLNSEVQLIIDNYDKTTDELLNLLDGHRSKKSIARKIEKLREEGKLGERSKQTIKRAYRQRKRRTKAEMDEYRKQAPVLVDEDYQPVEDDNEYQPIDED
jgi:RNA processing factor Prp31